MTDGYELTLHGLIRKRSQLAGEVEAMNASMASIMASLSAIDMAIRVLKPDIDLGDLPTRSPSTRGCSPGAS